MVFTCESQTIMKAECWSIDVLNCGVGEDSWVPWTARRSTEFILKEISPEYSLEVCCLKFKPILLPPDAKNWLIGKDPDSRKDWRREEKGTSEDEIIGWHQQLNGHEFEQAPGVSGWTGKPGMLQSKRWQRVGHDWATELNWTEVAYTDRTN